MQQALACMVNELIIQVHTKTGPNVAVTEAMLERSAPHHRDPPERLHVMAAGKNKCKLPRLEPLPGWCSHGRRSQ